MKYLLHGGDPDSVVLGYSSRFLALEEHRNYVFEFPCVGGLLRQSVGADGEFVLLSEK